MEVTVYLEVAMKSDSFFIGCYGSGSFFLWIAMAETIYLEVSMVSDTFFMGCYGSDSLFRCCYGK